MVLKGRAYTRREIEQRVGNLAQIGGTRHITYRDGRAQGVRGIDVRTGTGLEYTVVNDRGLDICDFRYKGTNLVYLTPNGMVNPAFYDLKGFRWFRTFFGGLATTCGLTYFGAPGKDGDEELGLHGRYSTLPADTVCDLSRWEGDEYILEITAKVRESELFSEKLTLTRSITSRIGSNELVITDTVRNNGFESTPFTLCYHMNFGFPLLTGESELHITSTGINPYTDHARSGMHEYFKMEDPVRGFEEMDFLHSLASDDKGYAHACLANRTLENGVAVALSFRTDTFPHLSEWKMMGEGDYVLGLEPTNVMILDRGLLKEKNMLPTLEPEEERTMETRVRVLDGEEEIDAYVDHIKKIVGT